MTRAEAIAEGLVIKAEGAALGLSDQVIVAFRNQKSQARRRGIPFLFTLGEWWLWWRTDARWERRWLNGQGLVMARFGDIGPYHPSNVYAATNAENVSFAHKGKTRQRRKHQPLSEADAAVGALFREARVKRGLSQKKVAETAGIQCCTLIKLEAGRANPTLAMLGRITRAIGADFDTEIAPNLR